MLVLMKFRRYDKPLHLYTITLVIVTTLSSLIMKNYIIFLYFSFILIFSLFFSFVNQLNLKKLIVNKNYRFYLILIVIPALEEILYRQNYFLILEKIGFDKYAFFILSNLFFVFAHYFKYKDKSYKLLLISIPSSIFYIYTENIHISILIHTLYNLFVFLLELKKYERKGWY